MKKNFAAIALLFAAALACYGPSRRNGFVWDDTALVLRDPFIRSWRLIGEGTRHFLFTDATPSNFFRPVQRISYTIDYALFAFRPAGWHALNIVFHALAAAMFFLFSQELCARFFDAKSRARFFVPLFAALAWVVHPVHNAAVCYVSGRADLLAALFGFAALFLVLKSRGQNAPRLFSISAAVCFLLAMLSKESGAMFLVVALSGWMLDGFSPRFCLAKNGEDSPRKVTAFAPLFAALFVVAIYCALRFSAEKDAPPPPKPVPIAVRPILVARAMAEYAGLLVAPVNLHMERELIATGNGGENVLRAARLREYQTLLGMALLVALALWMRREWRREPLVFLALLACVITYLPVSNLTPLNANAAEHWLYVPGAFLFLAAAAKLAKARFAKPVAFAALVWIAALGARTYAKNFDWKNQRVFFEKNIAHGGDTARMWDGLGAVESAEKNDDAAIHAFHEALKRDPDDPFAMLNLAHAFTRKKDFERARAMLDRARKSSLTRSDALLSEAVVDFQEKKCERTDLLREAVRLDPKNWDARKKLINHLAQSGHLPEAIQETRKVLDAQPWRAEAWRALGSMLLRTGARDSARVAFEQAAHYDVHDEPSRQRLKELAASASPQSLRGDE